jgi:hypothetical protein
MLFISELSIPTEGKCVICDEHLSPVLNVTNVDVAFFRWSISAWGNSDRESLLLRWRRMGGTEPRTLCKDIYFFTLTKDEKPLVQVHFYVLHEPMMHAAAATHYKLRSWLLLLINLDIS